MDAEDLDDQPPQHHAAPLVAHLLQSRAATMHLPVHVRGLQHDGAVYEVVVVRCHAAHTPEQLLSMTTLDLKLPPDS